MFDVRCTMSHTACLHRVSLHRTSYIVHHTFYLLVQQTIGGKHLSATLPMFVTTIVVGDSSSSFHQDNGSCRHIPGLDE